MTDDISAIDNIARDDENSKSQPETTKADDLENAAQALLRNGLIPVPLKPGSKVPAGGHGWQRKAVADAAKTNWSKVSGLGVLGGHGGLVPIDIDSEDPEVLAAISEALPPTIVKKKGRRGETWFYRASEPIDARRFKAADDSMLVEVLTAGQTVLPPTVHPETRRPYAWTSERTLLDTPAVELPEITPAHIAAVEKALQRWLPATRPKPITGQGLKQSSKKRYIGVANAALKGEVEALAVTESGGRNLRLYVAACKLGKWFYNGIIKGEDLEKRLLEACEENGLARDDGEAQCMATIESGLWKARDDFLPDLDKASEAPGPTDAWVAHKTLDKVPYRAQGFACWPYIVEGERFNIVGARGGTGKGVITSSWVAAVTTGSKWPMSDERAKKGRVLWFEAEDPDDTVLRPRLETAGADLSQIEVYRPKDFPGWEAVRRYIEQQPDIRMIVLSPLVQFLRSLPDMNSETEVRKALEELQDAVRGKECAVVGLCHLNKKADLDALERILGSVAFVNVCASVLLGNKEPPEENEENPFEWVRWVHAKHNLSPRGADWLSRSIHVDPEHPREQFVKAVWQKADKDVDPEKMFQAAKVGPGKRTARAWLFDYLNSMGPSRKSDVLIAADKEGFKRAAIEKAYSRSEVFEGDVEEFHGEATWSLVTR